MFERKRNKVGHIMNTCHLDVAIVMKLYLIRVCAILGGKIQERKGREDFERLKRFH